MAVFAAVAAQRWPHGAAAARARGSHQEMSAPPGTPPTADTPPTRRELLQLHGGLILTNVIWSFMHVIMAVPLRRGANAAVLSFYREVIGCAALTSAAVALERCGAAHAWRASHTAR